jgi:hypothetical protein
MGWGNVSHSLGLAGSLNQGRHFQSDGRAARAALNGGTMTADGGA